MSDDWDDEDAEGDRQHSSGIPRWVIGLLVGFAALVVLVVLVAALGVFAISRRQQATVEIEQQINRDHERDTFLTEVENQLANARSQITSARARLQDGDAQGAVGDLNEAERILGDMELLAEDFTSWNTLDGNLAEIAKRQDAIDQVSLQLYAELGRAHAKVGTPGSYALALGALEKGLEHGVAGRDALRLRLEIARIHALTGDVVQARKEFELLLVEAPDDLETRLLFAKLLAESGEEERALKELDSAVRQGSVEGRLARARIHFEAGRSAEALADLKVVLRQDDASFAALLLNGRCHMSLGRFEKAGELLSEAINVDPRLPEGYYYRGLNWAASGGHAQAIKDFEVALSRSETFYPAQIALGGALARSLDYERARAVYEGVLAATGEAGPFAAEACAGLASMELIRGDALVVQLEAERVLRERAATPDGSLGPRPSRDALFSHVERLQSARLMEAGRRFEQATTLDPNCLPALLGSARLAVLKGDMPAAAAALKVAEANLPPAPRKDAAGGDRGSGWEDLNPDGARAGPRPVAARVETFTLKGEVALRSGRLSEASDAFQRATAEDPASPFALMGAAKVALAEGREPEARALFAKRAGQRDGRSEEAFFLREGERLREEASRSGRPAQFTLGIEAYARSVSANPRQSLAFVGWARLCRDMGSLDEALNLTTRAVDVDPFCAEAYAVQGVLLAQDLPAERDPETGRPMSLRNPKAAEAAFGKLSELASTPLERFQGAYGTALARSLAAGDDREVLRSAAALADAALDALPERLGANDAALIALATQCARLRLDLGERLGDVDAARERVAKLSALTSEQARQAYAEGRGLMTRLRYKEAIERFDRALELDPTLADAAYDRGAAALKLGSFIPGILDLGRALELDPRRADTVFNKVYQISYVVDLNRVITEMNKIVDSRADAAHVVFMRGFFYSAKAEFKSVSREDLALGIADYGRAVELNPSFSTAHLYRGELRTRLAQLEDGEQAAAIEESARVDLARGLELDPQSGVGHYLLAKWWSLRSSRPGLAEPERARRQERAIESLAAALKAGFKGFERLRNDKGFDPIRGLPAFGQLTRGR